MTQPSHPHRAWAEIDAQALAHNLTLLQDRFPQTRTLAVVKADAYGHGMDRVVPVCTAQGVTDFGVATAAEGVRVRGLAPQVRILLLGPPLADELPEIVRHGLIPFLSDLETGQALAAEARRQGVTAEAHLDVDTGIARSGAAPSDVPDLLARLDRLDGLAVTGIATHFASADDDPADAAAQHALFQNLLARLGERALALDVHAANSPGALNVAGAGRHALIRPGLLLYGVEPTPGLFASHGTPFRPVLSLKARVTLCRPLPGGATISYSRTYTVPPGGGVYATVAIGYGDGYPRRLSGQGWVLLRGRRAPICGRVCMDQLVADVSAIPDVGPGDIATLIGTDGPETLTAGGLAEQIQTTPHEITTGLTARIPRLPG